MLFQLLNSISTHDVLLKHTYWTHTEDFTGLGDGVRVGVRLPYITVGILIRSGADVVILVEMILVLHVNPDLHPSYEHINLYCHGTQSRNGGGLLAGVCICIIQSSGKVNSPISCGPGSRIPPGAGLPFLSCPFIPQPTPRTGRGMRGGRRGSGT